MALLLSLAAASIAGYGYYEFLKSDYNTYGWIGGSSWLTDSGYTTAEWVYFLFATYFLPVAIIFLVVFAVNSFNALSHSSTAKLSAYYLLFVGLLLAAAYSVVLSYDVMQCITYLCVAGVDDSIKADDTAGEGTIASAQVFVGMLYFFIAVFFLAIFGYYIVVLHIHQGQSQTQSQAQTQSKNGGPADEDTIEGSDPLHPLYPFSLLQGEGGGDQNKPLARRQTEGAAEAEAEAEAGESAPLLHKASRATASAYGVDDERKENEEDQDGGPRSPHNNDEKRKQDNNDDRRLSRPAFSSTSHAIWAAVLLLVFYPFLIFAACALPTWWANFTRTGIQTYQKDLPSTTAGPYYYLSLANGNLVLKLFPDIIAYYLAIYALAATALLAKVSPPLARFLGARPFPSPFLTVGDALAASLVLGLLVSVFTYFYILHGWEQDAPTDRSNAERAARSMGQVANVVAGLLILPVTRNSAWTWLFGLSRESVLIYHQLLGITLLLVIATHMFLWWVVFAEQDAFPHDIFAVPTIYHADNFTIPLAQLTFFIMLIVFGVFTWHSIRRSNYRLFYYLHLFSLVVWLVMLWHATMSWYFLLGGLVLWAVDWLLRVSVSSSVTVRDVALEVVVGSPSPVVKVSYLLYTATGTRDATAKASASTQEQNDDQQSSPVSFHAAPYSPGQHCYLNIPCLGPSDAHPFSISSSPLPNAAALASTEREKTLTLSDELAKADSALTNASTNAVASSSSSSSSSDSIGWLRVTHHVRAMGGAGSWTRRLHALACDLKGARDAVRLNVEGPYGVPWDTQFGPSNIYDYTKNNSNSNTNTNTVVFIAGGVGITPLISAYRYLYLTRASTSSRGNKVSVSVTDNISGSDKDNASVVSDSISDNGNTKANVSVRLIWVVRSRAEADMFAGELGAMRAAGSGFDCSIHVTSGDVGGEAIDKTGNVKAGTTTASANYYADSGLLIPGRPDLAAIIQGSANTNMNAGADSARRLLVSVCGPAAMVEVCATAAQKFGAAFKREVFEL